MTSSQLARCFNLVKHPVERERLIGDVCVTQQLRIRRQEVRNAIHLDAVPRVIDHRPVGVRSFVAELLDGAAHGDEVEIVLLTHLREADPAQRGGDDAGVVGGVRELAHIGIIGVADHKRDAPA